MNTEKKKCRTIYSQKLAGYLMLRGFVLAESRKDAKGTGRTVFFFYDSKKLDEAIIDYKSLQ